MNLEERVRRFHRQIGHPCPFSPLVMSKEQAALRIRLLREELAELEKAIEAEDLPGILGESVDLAYVAAGTAAACGLPFEVGLSVIHRANMQKKANPQGGKAIKPEGWTAPDLPKIVEAAKIMYRSLEP